MFVFVSVNISDILSISCSSTYGKKKAVDEYIMSWFLLPKQMLAAKLFTYKHAQVSGTHQADGAVLIWTTDHQHCWLLL